MCSKCDSGIVIKKIHFILTLLIVLVAVISDFAYASFRLEQNEKLSLENREKIEDLRKLEKKIDNIEYNVKNICIYLKIKHIGIE